MIDSGAVMELADPVLTELLTNVISSACVSTAKRAKKGLATLRSGGDTLTNARLVEMLLTPALGEGISLSKLVALPQSSVTAHELREALGSLSVTNVAQQLVCAHLLNAQEQTFAQIRNTFVLALIEALDGRVTQTEDFRPAAEEIFQLIRENTAAALTGGPNDPAREPTAEIFAQLTLIRASIENAVSVFDSLDSRKDARMQQLSREWKARYRQQCAKYHGVITPPDFKERNTVPLDKIYVPTRISVVDETSLGDRHRSLYDIMDEIDRDVLVGDPGGGKSTTTHAIAYRLAETENALLPFVVVLREYAIHSDSLSIVEYIEKQLRTLYQAEAPKDLLQTYLDAGEALVIFDGLDELVESSRRIAIAERIELFSARFPHSRIYVTSRKVGYKEARLDPGVFRVLQLEGYTQQEVELYVSKWFGIQVHLDGLDTSEVQRSFIRESEAIPDLRRNPLLLALLCIIYRGQGYLPKNRIGIYEQCSQLLFETWDKSRGIVFDFTFESYIQDALKHLAFWMWHDKNADEGVSEPRLIHELTTYFSGRAYETEDAARRAATEFVKFCSGRAWVLSEAGVTPDHVSLFKFTHRTFMEYFAAIQVNRLNPEPKALARFLLPKIARNEWDTVGQLCVHLIHRSADQGADVAITQMLKSSQQRSISYRENVLDFIARCLSDLTVNPKLVKKVIRASTQNLHKARPIDGSLVQASAWESTSWRRLAHLDTNADAVRDEFSAIVDELFAKNDRRDVEVATLLVMDIPYSGGHRALQINGRPRDWKDFSREKIEKHSTTMLSLTNLEVYVGIELFAYGFISFDDFILLAQKPDDATFDFLFRPLTVLVDNGAAEVAPLAAYLMSAGTNLVAYREIEDSPFGHRWLLLLKELSKLLPATPPPFISEANVSISRTSWPWSHVMSDFSADDVEGFVEEWSAACVLLATYLELIPPDATDERKMRSRGKESLVFRVASARANGHPIPGEVLEILSRASNSTADIMEKWFARETSFVKPLSEVGQNEGP